MIEGLTRSAWMARAKAQDPALVEAMAQGAYARGRLDRPAKARWEDCTETYRELIREEVRWSLAAAAVSGWRVVRG